jgi:hypothetical protein
VKADISLFLDVCMWGISEEEERGVDWRSVVFGTSSLFAVWPQYSWDPEEKYQRMWNGYSRKLAWLRTVSTNLRYHVRVRSLGVVRTREFQTI